MPMEILQNLRNEFFETIFISPEVLSQQIAVVVVLSQKSDSFFKFFDFAAI